MRSDFIKYAIVSALLEEKKNYLDIYFPFILRCFKEENCGSLGEIHVLLKELFTIDFPINSIKDLISRYNKKTFVAKKNSKSDWDIELTSEGRSELNELLESERKAGIKIESFYRAFSSYLSENGLIEYPLDQLKELINNFITKNLFQISIVNGESKVYDQTDEESHFEKSLIFFLSEIKETRLDLVEVFDELWRGTIIWNEIQKNDLKKSISALDKNLTVYVDTNFILSLLDLHHPIINQAALELYNLLVGIKNIELVVLNSTLQEAWDLLGIYQYVKDDFFDIEVDSVFYYLKKKKFTVAKLEELRDNLKETLRDKFNITFDETSSLKEKEQYWYAEIFDHLHGIRKAVNDKKGQKKKSEDAIEKNSQHDTTVIVEVLKYKDRYATNLEKSKGIFLTRSHLKNQR